MSRACLTVPFGQAFRDNGLPHEEGSIRQTCGLMSNRASWPLFAWLWKTTRSTSTGSPDRPCRPGRVSHGAFVFVDGLHSDKVSFLFPGSLRGWRGGFAGSRRDPIQPGARHRLGQHQSGAKRARCPINPGRDTTWVSRRCCALHGCRRGSIVALPARRVIMGHDRGAGPLHGECVRADGATARALTCAPTGFRPGDPPPRPGGGFLRRVQWEPSACHAARSSRRSDLKGQRRFGGDLELWLGSDVLPFVSRSWA